MKEHQFLLYKPQNDSCRSVVKKHLGGFQKEILDVLA